MCNKEMYEVIEAQTVTVDLWRYEQLIKKEAMLDMLTKDKELSMYVYSKTEG